MSWKLLVGGTIGAGGVRSGATDYGQYLRYESFRAYLSSVHLGGHGSLTLTIPQGAIRRPKGFQLVTLQDNLGVNAWTGIIQQVAQTEVRPGVYDYQLTLSDLTRWLDHVPVGNIQVYPKNPSDTIDQMVKDILTDWLSPGAMAQNAYGIAAPLSVPIFTDKVLATTVGLAAYQPNWLPCSQVIDYLARLASCAWFVDANASLNFLPFDSGPNGAPLPNQSVTFPDLIQSAQGNSLVVITTTMPTLDADNDANSGPGHYRSLQLTEDVSSTMSGTVVRGFLAVTTTTITESPTSTQSPNPRLVGDVNKTRVFILNNRPVAPVLKGYMTVTATIGGFTYTFTKAGSGFNPGLLKTEYKDGQPTDGPISQNTCYVNEGGNTIRFNGPAPNLGAPDSGTSLTVTYNYYEQGYGQQLNGVLSPIIASREGFGPGYYLDVLSDSSLSTPLMVTDGTPGWVAAMQLEQYKYGQPILQARFSSYTRGWYPGNVFAITSQLRGDSQDDADTAYTGWGTTFSQRFYVTQATISIINDDTLGYDVQATSNLWGQ